MPERASDDLEKRPGFGVTVATVLLPVVLMLAKALVDIVVDDPEHTVQRVFDVDRLAADRAARRRPRRHVHAGPGGRLHQGPDRHHRREVARARSPASC